MARNLKDKVILITGASSGIGAATAIACAQAGMHVTLAARRLDKLHTVAGRIEQLNRRAVVIACDVAGDDAVRELFAQSWQAHGRLDAVFANAGYGLCASVLDTSDAEHRAIFEVNYFGTVRCVQYGIPDLRRTNAGLRQMLICSSAASEIGLPMYGAYCATKAAQDSLAGALRAELASERIAVTSVHPGGTETEFFTVAHSAAGERNGPRNGPGRTNTPSAFVQRPEQVASAVLKALRRPRPEVWPTWGARYGLALTTAFPRLGAWMMRRHARQFVPIVHGPEKDIDSTKGT